MRPRVAWPDSTSNPIPSDRVREAVTSHDLTLRSRVEERELISRVLAGDPSAERALYDAHVDRVFRLAYRMAGDMDRAQDYTQETFIRAFSRLGDFRGEAALSTWLGSIAVSVTLNGLRKVRRQNEREVALDDALPTGKMVREAEPDLKDRLRRAIDSLPEGYRAVFVMHDVEGYTHEEIATSLGVHPGTSKAQLFRARARLRAELADFVRD
jgi:RNA polymerase sigma-70 factor (ECF subfamily)